MGDTMKPETRQPHGFSRRGFLKAGAAAFAAGEAARVTNASAQVVTPETKVVTVKALFTEKQEFFNPSPENPLSEVVAGSKVRLNGPVTLRLGQLTLNDAQSPIDAPRTVLYLTYGPADTANNFISLMYQGGMWQVGSLRITEGEEEWEFLEPVSQKQPTALSTSLDGMLLTVVADGQEQSFSLAEPLKDTETELLVETPPLGGLTIASATLEGEFQEVLPPSPVPQPPPEQPPPQEKPLPYKRKQVLETAAVNNIGDSIGIVVTDETFFNQIIAPVIRTYRPNGVEYFIYNKRSAPKSIIPFTPLEQEKLQRRLKDVSLSPYYLREDVQPGSFLLDTAVITGVRPEDGVFEQHLGLFPAPGATPTEEQVRKLSSEIEGELFMRYFLGNENLSNPDVIAAGRAMGQRHLEGKSLFLMVLA